MSSRYCQPEIQTDEVGLPWKAASHEEWGRKTRKHVLTSKLSPHPEKKCFCLPVVLGAPFVHSSNDVLNGDIYLRSLPEALTRVTAHVTGPAVLRGLGVWCLLRVHCSTSWGMQAGVLPFKSLLLHGTSFRFPNVSDILVWALGSVKSALKLWVGCSEAMWPRLRKVTLLRFCSSLVNWNNNSFILTGVQRIERAPI